MAKITKHQLDFENEVNYEMIGICAHVGDYRLVWEMNDALHIQLEKSKDLFPVKYKKHFSVHPFYSMKNEEERWTLYLIKNKHEGHFLIPEKQQIDYFLFVCDNFVLDLDQWVEKLRLLKTVIAAYSFDPLSLPTTEHIYFE